MAEVKVNCKINFGLHGDDGNHVYSYSLEVDPRFDSEQTQWVQDKCDRMIYDYECRSRTPETWLKMIKQVVANEKLRAWVCSIIWFDHVGTNPLFRDDWEDFYRSNVYGLLGENSSPDDPNRFPPKRDLRDALTALGYRRITDEDAAAKALKSLKSRKLRVRLRNKKNNGTNR